MEKNASVGYTNEDMVEWLEHGSQFRYDKIDWLKFWLFDSNISIFGHWYVLQVFRGTVPVTRGFCRFTTRLQMSP